MLKSIKKVVAGVVLSGVLMMPMFGSVVIPFGTNDVYAEGENSGSNSRGIQISPASAKINLNPGETYEGKFTITNKGANEYTFKIYASPYAVVGENYTPQFEGNESSPRAQIARWISFGQDTYVLQPEEVADVTYKIVVPSDAAGGGQYAAIFASADVDENTTSTIQSIGRVGLVVYANVSGDINENGEVIANNISPIIFDKPISASATIKNTGNSDFVARQTLVVKSAFGGKTVFSQTRGFEILPETTRLVNMEWSDSPALGLFKVTQVVDADFIDKQDETLGQWTKTVLVMPVFLFVIIIIIVVILLMMIVLKVASSISRRRA
ncbi:MAG: hypothetical protein LBM97_01095 [Candidatus Nomurabacteria bacterium]|jgi:hypothetical protein|nr:hypothetical protein [Candidatus Nomurabacteria bacterium]